MKIIELSRDKYAIVDDADYGWLNQWVWKLSPNGYAYRNDCSVRPHKKLYMHRIISRTSDDLDTDHINQKKLDNRRANLRQVTRSQNMHNITSFARNTSGRKGVTWHKAAGKWSAQIMINYRNNYLGLYDSFDDAVYAREQAERIILKCV
jgi:hypothetical protein